MPPRWPHTFLRQLDQIECQRLSSQVAHLLGWRQCLQQHHVPNDSHCGHFQMFFIFSSSYNLHFIPDRLSPIWVAMSTKDSFKPSAFNRATEEEKKWIQSFRYVEQKVCQAAKSRCIVCETLPLCNPELDPNEWTWLAWLHLSVGWAFRLVIGRGRQISLSE